MHVTWVIRALCELGMICWAGPFTTHLMDKAGAVLLCCRKAILDALSPLAVGKDSGVAGGEGAIYFWAKLPSGANASLC